MIAIRRMSGRYEGKRPGPPNLLMVPKAQRSSSRRRRRRRKRLLEFGRTHIKTTRGEGMRRPQWPRVQGSSLASSNDLQLLTHRRQLQMWVSSLQMSPLLILETSRSCIGATSSLQGKELVGNHKIMLFSIVTGQMQSLLIV